MAAPGRTYHSRMAEAIAFDTHRFVNLATKTDLEVRLGATKTDLEVKLGAVKADLEVKIEAVKADILKWMVTAMIAQTALIVALIRLL